MPDFDPRPHLIKLKGKDYLEVRWRLVWLTESQARYTIDTEPVTITDTLAIFKATVTTYDDDGAILRRATGTKSETPKGFADFIEKSETGAIGRALGALGFGTQYAVELEGEGEVARPVDSPTKGDTKSPDRSFADRVHVDERPRRQEPRQQPTQAPQTPPAPRNNVQDAKCREAASAPASPINDFTAFYTKWRAHKISNLDDVKRAIGRDPEGMAPAALDRLLDAAGAGTGTAAGATSAPTTGQRPRREVPMAEAQNAKLHAEASDRFGREGHAIVHALAGSHFGIESVTELTKAQASSLIQLLIDTEPAQIRALVAEEMRQQAIERGQQELGIDAPRVRDEVAF